MRRRSSHATPCSPWLLGAAVVTFAACATHKDVRTVVGEEVAGAERRAEERISQVEDQVEANQTRLSEHDRRIGAASQTAQDALDRAIAAGKLAEGKLLYEQVLADDKVRFAFDKAELSDEGKAALEDFAGGLKTRNDNVFVEIQGHTDGTGEEAYNLRLGEARAEAVRRYLSLEGGLPLHRMSVISYGETAPVADNSTREGRAQNRRVVLVVLK